MTPPKVFISYSHDSEEHSERILQLAWALRRNGSGVQLDQFHNEEIVDWPRWCNEQTSRERSDFVVCICTAEYRRRIEGRVPPEKGKGVYWEGALLDDDIYDEKGDGRIIPVLLDKEPESSIPRFLRGWTYCRVSTFALSDSGYEHLIRILTHQARVEMNAVGPVPVLPAKHALGASATSAGTAFKADISRILKYAPAELIGREDELKLLDNAWAKTQNHDPQRPRVLTFVALGGEGKTALITKWAAGVAAQDWPGCDAAFAWSFYSQGTREQQAASSDLFLKEALNFFGDDADKAFAAGNAGVFEKGQRLARIVGQRHSLLILDGLEPLQYAPTSPTAGQLKDQGIAALLRGLAQNSHGLCIVTTRYSLPDLNAFKDKTAAEKELKRLSREAGVRLLKAHGVVGIDRRNIALKDGDDNSEKVSEFEKLVEDVDGHALTLHIMGSFLKKAFRGDIRCRNRVTFEKASKKTDNDHAMRAMGAYARWMEDGGDEAKRELAILRVMGLFDRPADAGCIEALLKEPAIPGLTDPLVGLAEDDWNLSLETLASAKLLTVNRDPIQLHPSSFLLPTSLDAHPLLREYFGRQLREQKPDAWRVAHRRLYEHLCKTTTDKKPNPTLEDLQPLYQAVAHGCQAGLQQEAHDDVLMARIWRGTASDGFYAPVKLGALASDLGAIGCFFEIHWRQVCVTFVEETQASLMNVAASDLKALGRLTEALEPLRVGLKMRIRQERWKYAAIDATTLSLLELDIGDVAGAIRDAEQSVTYADRSGDEFQQLSRRSCHAEALHQAGRRAEAETLFREVEQMQKKMQPEYPLLYSLQGFQYCDLLLAAPEHAAWQHVLAPSPLRGFAS